MSKVREDPTRGISELLGMRSAPKDRQAPVIAVSLMGMPPLPTIETPDSLARRTPLIAVGAIVFLAGALLLAFYLLIHRSGQPDAFAAERLGSVSD